MPRAGDIQAALERVLASRHFATSPRMSRFLRYVVEQTLTGNSDRVKEYTVGVDVFDKPEGYDPGADSTVRTEASKLRSKLSAYYQSEGQDDRLRISIPKGTYVPLFAERRRVMHSRLGMVAMAGGIGFIAIVALRLLNTREAPTGASWEPFVLTRLAGFEGEPSLSADGNFVAFAWTGSASPGPQDIWIKAIGDQEPRRLTNTPESEMSPSWSPDGRYIVFVRAKSGVFVASHLDGSERKISNTGAVKVRWAPDGRSVLVRDRIDGPAYAIFQVDIKTHQRRQLTYPAPGMDDWLFSVSPDGNTLAFIRYHRRGVADLFVMPMQGGEPRRLTAWNRPMNGVVWSPDGRDIIYSVSEGLGSRLWRIPAQNAGSGPGSRIMLPMSADEPSLTRPSPTGSARLAFRTGYADIGLRIIDLQGPVVDGTIRSIAPLCDSASVDDPGTFSHDGSKIVFASERSGTRHLWIASRDCSGLRQLTSLDSATVDAPTWSPDGRHIVFEATVAGNADLYLISAEGGQPKRITFDVSSESAPYWSRDGQSVYFSSDRSGQDKIWRLPLSGGEPVQLTRSGGFEPIEAHDGRTIYYLDRRPVTAETATLKQLVPGSAVESVLLEGIRARHWAVTSSGIVFVGKDGADWLNDVINVFDPDSRKIRCVGRLPFRVPPMIGVARLTASVDGRWALTHQVDRWDFDLMLIDNFR